MQVLFAALPLATLAATSVLCHRVTRGLGRGRAESSPGESPPGEVALAPPAIAQLRGQCFATPSRSRP